MNCIGFVQHFLFLRKGRWHDGTPQGMTGQEQRSPQEGGGAGLEVVCGKPSIALVFLSGKVPGIVSICYVPYSPDVDVLVCLIFVRTL